MYFHMVVKIPCGPADFYWKSGESTFDEGLQYLIDLRNYVANLEVPEDFDGYRQIAHSGDDKAVGHDVHRPAVLDACYENFFGRDYASISMPTFTPSQKPIEWGERKMTLQEKLRKAVNPNTKIDLSTYKINTGLHSGNISEAFVKVLDGFGIRFNQDSLKFGVSTVEFTAYTEVIVDTPDDFRRAKAIVQAYVHGNAQTPAELKQDMDSALAKLDGADKGRAPDRPMSPIGPG